MKNFEYVEKSFFPRRNPFTNSNIMYAKTRILASNLKNKKKITTEDNIPVNIEMKNNVE